MLKIEMDDVIGVLQSCKVQIGVIVGVLALLVIALIACRKMKKSQKFLIRSQSVIAAVLAILVTANTVCFGPMCRRRQQRRPRRLHSRLQKKDLFC